MPENQNMQKNSDNEAMLQEIVQNTEMGKNTLDELMGLTYDQKLKDEMMRQKNEYRRLNQQAHTALDAIGAQAKGQSAAARMSVSMGIRTRTMLDKTQAAALQQAQRGLYYEADGITLRDGLWDEDAAAAWRSAVMAALGAESAEADDN